MSPNGNQTCFSSCSAVSHIWNWT